MSVLFHKADLDKPKVDYSVLKRIIKEEIVSNDCKLGDLNYIFCSDDHLLSINKEFLQHDYYTDVITFDYSENGVVSGDVYISVERVIHNSELYKEDFSSELVRVIMHGLLHLLGYNDKTKDEILNMRKKEAELIECYAGSARK